MIEKLMRSGLLVIQLVFLSGCAIWIRGPLVEAQPRQGPRAIFIEPQIKHESVIDIQDYDLDEEEIEVIVDLKDCIEAGGTKGANLHNAYPRRVVCELRQMLSRNLTGTDVRLISSDGEKPASYYRFKYLFEEEMNFLQKVNAFFMIITLGVIPAGGTVKSTLVVEEIKDGKVTRFGTFAASHFIVLGLLVAPIYPFSDGVNGITIKHANLINGFVNWL